MPRPRPLSIGELNAIIPRLSATAQLLEGLARRSTGSGAKATTGGTTRKGKATRSRAGAAELQTKLIAVLKSGKGLQLGDIVRKVGAASGPVQYHLRALRAKKKARVVGERKQARWFAH
jgi:hypothetical protein